MQYQLVIFLIISSIAIWPMIIHGKSSSSIVRDLNFTVTSNKNQTGHWVTRFFMDKKSVKIPNSWKLEVKQRIEQDGPQSLHLFGLIVAPPPLPTNYELFSGVGYYKLLMSANTFDEASSICTQEGGHLAIINSEAESAVLQTIYKRHPTTADFAFIGFHDISKEGEFVTIFGEPLNSTGFTRWFSSHEPNGGRNENCGTVYRNDGLNDATCSSKKAFFCEFDLFWASA